MLHTSQYKELATALSTSVDYEEISLVVKGSRPMCVLASMSDCSSTDHRDIRGTATALVPLWMRLYSSRCLVHRFTNDEESRFHAYTTLPMRMCWHTTANIWTGICTQGNSLLCRGLFLRQWWSKPWAYICMHIVTDHIRCNWWSVYLTRKGNAGHVSKSLDSFVAMDSASCKEVAPAI